MPHRQRAIIWTNDDSLHHSASTILLIEAKWRIYASVNKPSVVQIMACCLVNGKPLSEPKMQYCFFGTLGTNLKMSAKWRQFCLSLNDLSLIPLHYCFLSVFDGNRSEIGNNYFDERWVYTLQTNKHTKSEIMLHQCRFYTIQIWVKTSKQIKLKCI